MVHPVLLAAATALLASPAPFSEPPIVGLAQAKDGDSLMVGQTEVRLFGIDAPEFGQTCVRDNKSWACGAEAADQLSRLVTGKHVRCGPVGKDTHQRTLARCFIGNTDVNREMVNNGFAVAYRHYSLDYVGAEENAKAAKRGLWAGTFQMPSDYRQSGRAPAERTVSKQRPSTAPSSWSERARKNCSIKGNRNRKGEWIYHLPGMPYYEETRPEDIFCTEGEAQAAGYRRSRARW
jgi:endonuclease YncB( thermonuclease family)